MKRKLLYALGGLVALVLIAFVYLIKMGDSPTECTFAFDATAMRTLANSMAGQKPSDIRAERITGFRFPRAMVAKGESFDMVDMDVFAYQLVYPDQTIVLDTAMSEQQAKEGGAKDYDASAWQHLVAALHKASSIFVTHEHSDHLGGLIAGGDESVWKHAHLNPEQQNPGANLRGVEMPAAAQAAFAPLKYESMTALAPGLVAIKTPGHTPGSQMFFVQRADGKELLFTGDTAWQMFAIEDEAPPPNGVHLMLHNDMHANACQIAALHKLEKSDAKIEIMPGHDRAQMAKLVGEGAVSKGFLP